ncbi:MAG: ATP-binding cassette domain-containing protein [Bacteroidia bacterium]
MKISLENVGKKFNRQWLFKNISYEIGEKKSCVLTGNNGSGKSTLLQMIFGFQTISIGKIIISKESKIIPAEEIFQNISFTAPYLELPEELTPAELLRFHFIFKAKDPFFTLEEIVSKCKLENSLHKQIKFFSSGMKQRLKLALVFFSTAPVLLLDEPCSNLDAQGIQWYLDMIGEVAGKRTIVIASNQEFEYDFCEDGIRIEEFRV